MKRHPRQKPPRKAPAPALRVADMPAVFALAGKIERDLRALRALFRPSCGMRSPRVRQATLQDRLAPLRRRQAPLERNPGLPPCAEAFTEVRR